MKILYTCITASLLLLMTACGSQQQIINYEGYHLVFHDEFNYTGAPNPKKWDYEIGFIRNKERQWYQKENAFVKDGILTITAKKEHKTNDFYNPNSDDWRLNTKDAEYTSASVISRGKFEFKYGKVQIRAKINTTEGQWPAFWMLGSNRGPVAWPACGEIDILEFYRKGMHANLAWQGKDGNSQWSPVSTSIDKIGDQKFWQDFHVWTMDWDKDYIKIYVDDFKLNETKITDIKNGIKGNQPFHETFFMVMNLALGQGGENIPENSLPSQYLIDYVRVYQKK